MLQRINLVPQIALAEKIRKRIPIFFVIFIAVICFFLYSRLTLLNYRLTDKEKEINQIGQRIEETDQLQQRIIVLSGRIKNQKKEYSETAGRVADMENIAGEKRNFSRILTIISNSLPSSVKCNKIIIQDNNGEISGSTLHYQDLPELVRKMKEDSRFRVELQDLDRIKESSLEPFTFKIVFTLNIHDRGIGHPRR